MTELDRRLRDLVGEWEGTCYTWFEPGKLGDESKIYAGFQPILRGLFLRHTYKSTIQGQSRSGEETIAFNSVTKKYEVSWLDDFHMNYGILFSTGEPNERGFAVTGEYAVGPDSPPWGWRTVFEQDDKNHLTITAYNIAPDGQESKAVETKYGRRTP